MLEGVRNSYFLLGHHAKTKNCKFVHNKQQTDALFFILFKRDSTLYKYIQIVFRSEGQERF